MLGHSSIAITLDYSDVIQGLGEANESAWSNPAHLSGGLRPFSPLRTLYQAFQQLEPQFIRAVGKILVGKVRSVFPHLPYDLRQGCDPRSPHAPSAMRIRLGSLPHHRH